MSNPLLADFNTPFQVPPFQDISENHYLEALEASLASAREEVDAIIHDPATPGFQNVIEALESVGQRLSRNSSILFNLNSAETNDEIQKVAQDTSPKLSAFGSEVKQNEALFAKVKAVYHEREKLELTGEQQRLKEYLP